MPNNSSGKGLSNQLGAQITFDKNRSPYATE